MIWKTFVLMPAAILSLAACQTVSSPVQEAHSLAQGACGGCHSVEPFGLSPNPLSPPFVDIANRPGLSRDTLSSWLRDAHNYPEEMEFSIADGEVVLLVDHILSLRRAGYQPPIQ